MIWHSEPRVQFTDSCSIAYPMEVSFCCHFDSDKLITRQLYCGSICKNCSNMIASNWITTRHIFHLVWIATKKSLVKWTAKQSSPKSHLYKLWWCAAILIPNSDIHNYIYIYIYLYMKRWQIYIWNADNNIRSRTAEMHYALYTCEWRLLNAVAKCKVRLRVKENYRLKQQNISSHL